MKSIVHLIEKHNWIAWLLFVGTIGAVFAIGLMAASIVERRQETFRVDLVQPINEWEPRNAVWGVNFPGSTRAI